MMKASCTTRSHARNVQVEAITETPVYQLFVVASQSQPVNPKRPSSPITGIDFTKEELVLSTPPMAG